MTALDNIKAALEAGVTGYANGDDWMVIGGNTVMLNSGRPVWARIATCEHAPNAAYIAACKPTAIRELLAYVESLERDAGRYQKLRNAKLWPTKDNEFIAGICVDSWDESGSGTQLAGDELDAAVDAVDAAMEQTK